MAINNNIFRALYLFILYSLCMFYQSNSNMRPVFNRETYSDLLQIPAKGGAPSSVNSLTATKAGAVAMMTSPKRNQKREEGWKEVVRRCSIFT